MELKQQLKLQQQLIMTPQLQQAIKLLQLNRLELVDVVREEIVNNCVLDEETPEGEEPKVPAERTEHFEAPPEKVTPAEGISEIKGEPEQNRIDWDNYFENYNSPGGIVPFKTYNEDLPSYEATLSKKTTLSDHLMWQLQMGNFSKEDELIANTIIGNIDDDGYLKGLTIEDIAQKLAYETDEVEEVLKELQHFDPVGVAARDLRECLLIQARYFKSDEIVIEIISNHLKYLERKNYHAITKELKVSLEVVIHAAKIIGSFEPKPGRSFSETEPHYITPDIYVYKDGENFMIVLNEDGLPKLKISSYYEETLKDQNTTDQTRDYIQRKLQSATWLIKSIHQRQRTIIKVMDSIIKHQLDFFDRGVEYLRPLVLKDIADDIGMHESTISRVTTNKYVHTPQGIFELKYFFNSGINKDSGEDIASESVKEKIKQIVSSEEVKRPFSDQKIVEILKQQGINIARRTVAKYREMLGILSSSKRKSLF